MAVQSVVSVESLLERGQYFLKEEQFAAADLYFNRVLDAQPKHHAAHWGLLLCAFQCKNTTELYTLNALPIDTNSHYHDAVADADADTAAHYRAVLDASLVACHERVIKNYEENNAFLLGEWISHYVASEARNRSVAALHAFATVDGKALNIDDESVAASLLALDGEYDRIDTTLPEMPTLVALLRERVKRLYTATMATRLQTLVSKHPATEKALTSWANPATVSAARIGLDGNGDTVCARFITLADALAGAAKKTVEDYAAVLFCYKQAVANATDSERQMAEVAMMSFVIGATTGDTTAELIRFFIDAFPQNGTLYQHYIEHKTGDWKKHLLSYPSDKETDDFLKKEKNDYTAEDSEALINKQRIRIDEIEKEYATILADITPYAEKALALLDDKKPFESAYTNYCERTLKERDYAIAVLRERQDKITAKTQRDDKNGAHGAVIKGIVATFFSYLTLAASLPLLLCALYTLKNPSILVEWPILRSILFAFGGCLVFHIVKALIINPLSKYDPKKYRLPAVCSFLLGAAPLFSLLFTIASTVIFGYTFVTLPKNLGTIQIGSADEFVYVKNIPYGDFVLTDDITLDDSAKIQLKHFYGTLDGNDHVIKNLDITEYTLRVNYGTVENVHLQSPTYQSDSTLVHKNKGTLRNVTVSNVKLDNEHHLFVGFTEQNRGTIEACTLKSVSGTTSSFVGITEENKGQIYNCAVSDVKLTVDSDIAGIAGVNQKTIAGCSFAGDVRGRSVYGITRQLRRDDATIKQCSTSGNFNAENYLSGLVGDVKNSCLIENCYSTAKLTLTPANMGGTYAIGLVGGIDDVGTEDCVTVRNCYFGGSVITKSSDSQYGYGYVGAIVGDTDPFSGSSSYTGSYYIEFDGCFAVASYRFGSRRYEYSRGLLPIKTDTSYFTSEHDISEILVLYNDTNFINKYKLLNKMFLTETMGWDEDVWDIQNGKLPTLKPYIVPAEQPDEPESTASEEVAK